MASHSQSKQRTGDDETSPWAGYSPIPFHFHVPVRILCEYDLSRSSSLALATALTSDDDLELEDGPDGDDPGVGKPLNRLGFWKKIMLSALEERHCCWLALASGHP